MSGQETGHRWLARLAKLRLDRASGDPAPHKPLLLPAVLDLADAGTAAELFPLTPELAFRFLSYWPVVSHRRRQRPDVRLPFHYLKSDGCWEPLTDAGDPSPHNRLTRSARLDPEFAALLGNPGFRRVARLVLIGRYFQPAEQLALCSMLEVPLPDPATVEQVTAAGREESRRAGRELRFQVSVVTA